MRDFIDMIVEMSTPNDPSTIVAALRDQWVAEQNLTPAEINNGQCFDFADALESEAPNVFQSLEIGNFYRYDGEYNDEPVGFDEALIAKHWPNMKPWPGLTWDQMFNDAELSWPGIHGWAYCKTNGKSYDIVNTDGVLNPFDLAFFKPYRDDVQITEMAQPSDAMRNQTFYHGTRSKEAAASIWKNGLDPQYTDVKYGDRKPTARPVDQRVYLSADVAYATVYAIGGSYLGHDIVKPGDDPKASGYVFVFDGNDLGDVQPDEDSVGEMIAVYWNRASSYYANEPKYAEIIASSVVGGLAYQAERMMGETTIRRAKDGNYTDWIKIGKKMLKHMSDAQKHEFIRLGAHVANQGKIVPRQMWEIPLKKVKLLAKDGSNFFEVARLRNER